MVTGWGGEGRGERIGRRLRVGAMELTKKLEGDRREGLGRRREGEKRGGGVAGDAEEAVSHVRDQGVLWAGSCQKGSRRSGFHQKLMALGAALSLPWPCTKHKTHGPSFQSDRNPQGPRLQDP